MNKKTIFLVLAILGLILPYMQMLFFIQKHGFDMFKLFSDLFATNSTAFFGYDLLIAAIASVIFMIFESKRLKMKNAWIPIASVFLIGLAFGLPLFLYMREKLKEKHEKK